MGKVKKTRIGYLKRDYYGMGYKAPWKIYNNILLERFVGETIFVMTLFPDNEEIDPIFYVTLEGDLPRLKKENLQLYNELISDIKKRIENVDIENFDPYGTECIASGPAERVHSIVVSILSKY